MLKNVILLFVFITVLGGCASNYSSVNFFQIDLPTQVEKNDFVFKYSYNAMQRMNNKRYLKYEMKHNIKIVALQITNNSEEAVTLTYNNFHVLVNGNTTSPLNPQTAQYHLKQGVVQYLLYSLLWLYVNNDNDPQPDISLPIGVPISIVNMLQAGSANKKVLKDLTEYNPIGQTIYPNNTINCLMVLYNSNYSPLDFEITVD
jgi:hypothetical protein